MTRLCRSVGHIFLQYQFSYSDVQNNVNFRLNPYGSKRFILAEILNRSHTYTCVT